MKTKIYVLTEPDGRIRYVGKTVRSLSARLTSHLCRARLGEKTHLFNWLRLILSAGHLPVISLVGEVEGNGNNEERAWIKYFRDEGIDLVNSTDGGDGQSKGYKPTEQTRKKLSDARKGKRSGMLGHHHSKKTLQRISETNKGRKPWNVGKHLSQETRCKISESLKGNRNSVGRHHSEDTRHKMSEAHENISNETCRKISEAVKGEKNGFFGRHHSAQARLKNAEAHKGNKNALGSFRSEENRRKISESLKGNIPWNKGMRKGVKI